MERLRSNPWLLALVSWAVAVGLGAIGYGLWQYAHHQAIDWSLVGKAALVAGALALVNAIRDRRRKAE